MLSPLPDKIALGQFHCTTLNLHISVPLKPDYKVKPNWQA